MAGLVLGMLILAMAGHSSATWCICKEGVNDATLQKTLDYACGAGADCTATHQNGACYSPNSVRAHCSYAVNSFFQKKGQTPGSCDFAGTATVVTSDPSTNGCVYPASASGTIAPPGTTTTPATPTTATPTTATPTINSPTGTSPLVTTPSTSSGLGAGGFNNGLGPSGTNQDMSEAAGRVLLAKICPTSSSLITLLFYGLVFWWA
ncbi:PLASMODESMATA CALLOSE-BINDING PROTEIN 3-like [Coffea eugenioides]|uniref:PLASMODESMATA CALLOSE-BINDING PROTEIN 2-like n=1 Tax=Coffea arabica TaxID=13443 RepID=A0ABM4U9I6_COFAR|nr:PLASMODESMATA CALLOSE-BINDING PROTEIN 3-like [Coffea eugenioides]